MFISARICVLIGGPSCHYMYNGRGSLLSAIPRRLGVDNYS
jgi:hypothetical protein